MVLARNVRGNSSAVGMAGLCEPCGSYCFRAMGREEVANGIAVASHGVWIIRRKREANIRGATRSRLARTEISISKLGSHAGEFASGRAAAHLAWKISSATVGNGRRLNSRRSAGFRTVSILSGILRQFFRWPPLRDEGRLAAHSGLHAAPHLSATGFSHTIHICMRSSAVWRIDRGRANSRARSHRDSGSADRAICHGRALRIVEAGAERIALEIFVR